MKIHRWRREERGVRVNQNGCDEPQTRYWFLSRLHEVKGNLVDRSCGRMMQFAIICNALNRIATVA
jgi:hypothetical protein